MQNYWLNVKGKKTATREINFLLGKYIGRKSAPNDELDKLFESMRKTVLKYFRTNPHQIKYFTTGLTPFDYEIDLKESNGLVSDVKFIAK